MIAPKTNITGIAQTTGYTLLIYPHYLNQSGTAFKLYEHWEEIKEGDPIVPYSGNNWTLVSQTSAPVSPKVRATSMGEGIYSYMIVNSGILPLYSGNTSGDPSCILMTT